MAFLPWYTPEMLSEEQLVLYSKLVSGKRNKATRPTPLMDENGRLYGPFNTLLHFPEEGEPFQQRGLDVRFGSRLEPTNREAMILFIAKRCGFPYEWYAHHKLAQQLKVPQNVMQFLDQMPLEQPYHEGDVEGSVNDYLLATEALITDNRIPTGTIERLEEHFHGASMQVIMLVGYYQDLGLKVLSGRASQRLSER